jgi:hypothetical protein
MFYKARLVTNMESLLLNAACAAKCAEQITIRGDRQTASQPARQADRQIDR